MIGEGDVVTLGIVHGTSHAIVALAEAQIIGWIIFGRFTLAPVPVSAILNIDDIKGMILHNGAGIL